jgi:hypothetical protein
MATEQFPAPEAGPPHLTLVSLCPVIDPATLPTAEIQLRTTSQAMEAFPPGTTDFFTTCTAKILYLDERVEPESYFNQHIRPKLMNHNTPLDTQGLVGRLGHEVARTVKQASLMRDIAVGELGSTKDKLTTDETVAFSVFKTLAKKSAHTEDTFGDAEELVAGLWLTFREPGQPTVPQMLEQAAADGDFDHLIAADLIGEAAATPVKKRTAEQQELHELFVFLENLEGVDPLRTIDLIGKSAAANLPPAQRVRVEQRRLQLITSLRQNTRQRLNYLQEHMLVVEPTTDHMFERRTREFAKSLRRQPNHESAPRHRPKIDQVAAAVESRKTGRNRRLGSTATRPEVKPHQHPLSIYAKGQVHLEDSPEFLPAITSGLGKTYKGDRALQQDLLTCLNFLRNLDMSHGDVRGIKGYEGIPGGLELKAKEAGMPLASPNGEKIRVIFTLGENGGIRIIDAKLRKLLDRGVRRKY